MGRRRSDAYEVVQEAGDVLYVPEGWLRGDVSIGETVLLPEYGASMIKLGDEEFHLIKDMDILGKLEG